MTKRFMLMIEIGKGNVQSPKDIASILGIIAMSLKKNPPSSTETVGRMIYDHSMNHVGSYCIEEDVE